jgi:hypothetical protein
MASESKTQHYNNAEDRQHSTPLHSQVVNLTRRQVRRCEGTNAMAKRVLKDYSRQFFIFN